MIAGTFDPLMQDTSPERIEASIINRLSDANYIIPNTNTSNGLFSAAHRQLSIIIIIFIVS